MSQSNDPQAAAEQISDLVKSGPDAVIELSEHDMDGVVGGTEMAKETYVNRVKTSDKQQKAVLDFIKG